VVLQQRSETALKNLRKQLEADPKLVHRLSKLSDTELARKLRTDRKLGFAATTLGFLMAGAAVGFGGIYVEKKFLSSEVTDMDEALGGINILLAKENQAGDTITDAKLRMGEALAKLKSASDNLPAAVDSRQKMIQRV
jgi:hypothetical protein